MEKKNNFWKQKNTEQKTILIVRIISSLLDGVIFFTPIFKGYIAETFAIFLVIQSTVIFILLNIFNKNSLEKNAIASIPYLGVWYAIYNFIKPTQKTE